VDFRNTVIIMTSNIGSQFILDRGTADWAEVETHVLAELRRNFKPEFLNRVDDIIIFHPLAMDQIEHIVDLQLERLKKLLSDRKLTLELTPEAKHVLAEEGFDPAFGARPLKRAIQRYLQNPLAMAVLEGRFKDGDHVLVTRQADGALGFEVVGHDSEAEEGAREPAAAGGRAAPAGASR
jgi:ATP-dependent Clp protease ATP-binding subunit ClpB